MKEILDVEDDLSADNRSNTTSCFTNTAAVSRYTRESLPLLVVWETSNGQ